MPRLIIEELFSQKRSAFNEQYNNLKEKFQYMNYALKGEMPQNNIEEILQKEKEHYLSKYKVIDLKYTDELFQKLISDAIRKNPPFDKTFEGKKTDAGFKDALIWETILLSEDIDECEQFYFFSSDKVFIENKEYLSNEFKEQHPNTNFKIRYFESNGNQRQNALNTIIEETDRLTLLVNDILDLSAAQSDNLNLNIEEIDLIELINEVIKRFKILSEQEDYKFIFNHPDKVIIHADYKRIYQVIYNLMNNAINYTGNDKKVYIDINEDKHKYIISIRDTGKGIKQEDLKHIWDKYYHSDKKHKRNNFGTGLGLSIVKNILQMHNYKYGVTSSDKGSTFYFEIEKDN